MKHIHFIINPIAGSGKHKISQELLLNFFKPEFYTITIKESSYKKHAIQLSKDSVKEQADIIVACGGDGTINEVASHLIGTNILLGIIPTGSGNGLASHLKIPKNINKSLLLIKQEKIKKIDIGKLNNMYFFSNTGIGFNAKVIKHYEASHERKLSGYIKATLKSLKELHAEKTIKINSNGLITELNLFMVIVSNTNQMGYNVTLTPNASLQDNLLDVVVIPDIKLFKFIWFGIFMFLKKLHLIKEVKNFQTEKLTLTKKEKETFQIQVDGEFYNINTNTINISILNKALSVIN